MSFSLKMSKSTFASAAIVLLGLLAGAEANAAGKIDGPCIGTFFQL